MRIDVKEQIVEMLNDIHTRAQGMQDWKGDLDLEEQAEHIMALMEGVKPDLTFRRLREVNAARMERFAGCINWTIHQWINALVGEVGELANEIKKIDRIKAGFPDDVGLARRLQNAEYELADIQCYLDLLANRMDVDLGDITIRKFNMVSNRHGFPEEL